MCLINIVIYSNWQQKHLSIQPQSRVVSGLKGKSCSWFKCTVRNYGGMDGYYVTIYLQNDLTDHGGI